MNDELRAVEAELQSRWPETKLDPSLERIRALMDILGEPQRSFWSIHITGTNGKTSVARMVDQLLRTFQLRTGRYTSPHVEAITERITIDGESISDERFVETYQDIAPYIGMVDEGTGVPPREDGPIRMSFFEALTGMAYAAFADAPVDVAVVEVGMGGSWDATNVVDGVVSVVTPISVDHADRLGHDAGTIAEEKSGIIKPDSVAVVAQQSADAAQVLLKRAVEVDATVAREGMEFGVMHRDVAVGGQLVTLRGLGGEYPDLYIPLYGAHQAHNASVALAAVEAFFGVGSTQNQALDIDLVREAFGNISSPGRLEVLRRAPTVLADASHNPAGAAVTVEAIREAFAFNRLVGVVSVAEDKDARGILEAYEPLLAEVVISRNTTPRAMDVDELAGLAVEVFGADRVEVEPRLDDALAGAVQLAEESGDLGGSGVLVTGSVVTVGEARLLLGKDREPGRGREAGEDQEAGEEREE